MRVSLLFVCISLAAGAACAAPAPRAPTPIVAAPLAAMQAGAKPIIVMFHYPPFLDRKPTEFARRIAEAGATTCIYGHLHRPHDWSIATQGLVEGVYYQLTACDYLGFGPVAVRGLDRFTAPAEL